MTYSIFSPAHVGPGLELEGTGTMLVVADLATINRAALATFPQSVGTWDAELIVYGPGDLLASIGIARTTASLTTYVGGDALGYGYRLDLGEIHNDGTSLATVAEGAKGDVIRLRLDLTTTTPTVTWWRNGTLVHTQPLPSTGPWAIAVSLGGSEPYGLRCFLNAGQRAYEYPPAGNGWYQPPAVLPGLMLASEDWLSTPTDDAPNLRYNGLLAGDGAELIARRSLDFWPWQRGIQSGAMVLTAYDDGSFAELLAGDARDLQVRIASIEAGQGYADRTPLFSAVIDNVAPADDLTVKLTCRDPLGLLDVPLQRRLVRPDADASSANTPWPVALGACRNVPAILLDGPNLTYAVSDTPMMGIGYVRDAGYPLDPGALPADFRLDATKTRLLLEHEPVGKLTVDVSSLGGDQLPQPADDILDGAGAPFTGDYGDTPDGWDDVGGSVPEATPVMGVGVLQFPLVQTSPTIYASLPVYTSGAVGSVALALDWIDAAGRVIKTVLSGAVTGTHAWADVEVIDTAPAEAVSARLRAVTSGHTAGVIRVGEISAAYVRYGDHDAIGLQNADFSEGLDGWTASSAGWVRETSSSVDGHDVDMDVAFFHGSGLSFLRNDGIAPVGPGERVTASCDAALYKRTDSEHPVAAVVIEWHAENGDLIDQAISTSLFRGDKGRFSRLTVTGTAPAGTDYAVFQLHGENSGTIDRGPRFANCSWGFALDPGLGDRTAIDIGDFSDSSLWQLGGGWSLHAAGVDGPDGAAYAEHEPGAPNESTSLTCKRSANISTAVSYLGWAGISTSRIGAGKSYQIEITIDSLPEDGGTYIAIATGKTIDSVLASWNKAGTYTVTITSTDDVDRPLYLLSIPVTANGSITPEPPSVGSVRVIEYDDTYSPIDRPTEPAELQAIKLADYVREILDVRGSQLGVQWSTEDAEAIDAATGYAGLGVYLDGSETAAQALDLALASYTACKWADGAGVIRMTRLVAPESVDADDRAFVLDINAMDGDLLPTLDRAPGLTTQMGLRRNWAQLSDGDLASSSNNFPLQVRQAMLRPCQLTVSTATPLAGAYSHALYAPAVVSCFDAAADAQAEVDRVADIYRQRRRFFAVRVFLDAVPGIELGAVGLLTYPKYGLDDGLPVMVADFAPDLLAGTAQIVMWG